MTNNYSEHFPYNTLPLNDLFNSMIEGVIVYDHAGKILQINSAALKIMGLSEEELANLEWFEKKTVDENLNPVPSGSYPSMIAIKTRKPQLDSIYGISQEDGSLKWVTINAIPILDKENKEVIQVVVTFVDVTDKKSNKKELLDIQKELERSESFLITILNALPVLVCYVDKNLVYRYANNAYENFVRLKMDDIVGKRVPDILGPEIFEKIKPRVEKVLKGEPQNFENEIKIQGMGERSVNVTFKPDVDSVGVKGYFAIIEDVTEIIKARDRIQQKEEEQFRILDSISAQLAHWNKDLINIHSNRAYAEFFNLSPGAIKGMHLKDVLGSRLMKESKPYLEKVLRGEPQTFERKVIDPKGNQKYIMVTYLPDIKNNEVVGYFVIGNDVTKLKNSEEKFKAVLELAPNPTLILNDHGEIEIANIQTLVQFNFEKDEIIGKSFKQLLPRRLHGIADSLFKDYIQAPSIVTIGTKFDLWARRKDGTEFPFEVSIGPLQTEGDVLFKCVIQDITERLKRTKEREELLDKELKARLEAEDATRKRDEMLAIVSHDLRNPLAVIVGNIEVLLRKRSDDKELVTKLEKMKHHSNLMLTMIKDLLDVHKMEEGTFDIESGKGIHEPCSIVKDICEAQEILMNENGLTLQVEIEKDLPRLSLDLTLINRVFQNLIGNSLKFTPPGGTIKVAAKKTREFVVFSVEDTGPGIENDLLPVIFDRFVQAKKTAHLGAGLGLPICKAIVEAHGGQMWIETKPGVGTKFFFSIPIPVRAELDHFH